MMVVPLVWSGVATCLGAEALGLALVPAAC